jgi:uncharacterized membrane protein YraQ (UPF0718 family)
MMTTLETPKRSTAKLWRGLVGWSIVGLPVAGAAAYFVPEDWAGELLGFAFLAAFIAIPVGLIGLATTSDSTGERVVSGILAAVVLLMEAAIILFAIAMTQV